MVPRDTTARERTVLVTPGYHLFERDGALWLEKTGLDRRDIARIAAIALLILWAGVALRLIDATPPTDIGPYLSFGLLAPAIAHYDDMLTRHVTPYRGSVISVMRKRISIGRLPATGEGGYRDGSGRKPALWVDGRAIAAERLVRVAVGEIDAFFRKTGIITVNLVLVDGVVLLAQFDEPGPARDLAAQLGRGMDIACDPVARTVCHSAIWELESPWMRAAVVVDAVCNWVLFILVLVLEGPSLAPRSFAAILTGSLLFHLALRHFVILKLARQRVEKSLLRAFGVTSTPVAQAPKELP